MLDLSSAPTPHVLSVGDIRRHERSSWWWWYGICIAATLMIAVLAARTVPDMVSLAFVLFFVGAVIVVLRPVTGLYITVVAAILGDPSTSGWYPFTKNFSSPESILYINHPRLIVNPLEVYLVLLLVGWLLQMMRTRTYVVHRGRLFWPVMVFAAFTLFGFVYGMAHHGDSNAALWESRPIFYIPVLYILATNLFTQRKQYNRLYTLVMIAVFANGLMALLYRSMLSTEQRSGLETLVAHGATLPMNAMFVLVGATWIYKGSSWARRLVLPLMAIPVMLAYLISGRRAAIVALLAGVLMLGVVMFWTHRRVFWKVAPVVLVLGTLYTAAFWNSTGTTGFPAQAIKSVISPNQVSERNQSSDQYRAVEKVDILATIRSNPITGIGFGQKFLRPVPLPQITSFLLSDYVTHNAVLWIWMKMGLGGFLAMLYLFGSTIRRGARAILRSPGGDEAAILVTSTAFVLMFGVFAYVDIAWDAQNMVFLAIAIAHIATARTSRPEPTTKPVEAPVLVAVR